MRRYELVYIAFDDLSAEELDSQLERYLSIITDYNGTIVKVDKWGRRRMAYPIQKRREGYYILIDFAGDSAIVPEMERRMRIDDKILRYISVKTDDEADPAKIEEEIAAIREAEARKQAAAAEAAKAAEAAEAARAVEAAKAAEAAQAAEAEEAARAGEAPEAGDETAGQSAVEPESSDKPAEEEVAKKEDES